MQFSLKLKTNLKIQKYLKTVYKSFFHWCKSFICQLATCIEFAFMLPQAELSTRPWHLSKLTCLPLSLCLSLSTLSFPFHFHLHTCKFYMTARCSCFPFQPNVFLHFSSWTFCPHPWRLTNLQFKCPSGYCSIIFLESLLSNFKGGNFKLICSTLLDSNLFALNQINQK